MECLSVEKIGLLVNTGAAILLAIGSSKATNVLAKFIDVIRGTYGTQGMGLAIPEVKKLSVEFDKAKKQSTVLNLIGWILFAVGFLIQFFAPGE